VVNVRKSCTPVTKILSEIDQVLEAQSPGSIDWVTFVGSGEPSLQAKIGVLIHQVKALTEKPVAVITNGALLHMPQV
jgi:wyosine [tRNA(Phe)-imidazoG37] synthetase (radical SAM superfamily)